MVWWSVALELCCYYRDWEVLWSTMSVIGTYHAACVGSCVMLLRDALACCACDVLRRAQVESRSPN